MSIQTHKSDSSKRGYDEDGAEAIVAEINITPLTDIFLVLLIIFMVTSSVMTQMGVEVTLPQASAATASQQAEGAIVTLLKGGGLQVNGIKISQDQFETALKKVLSTTSQKLVILEGDRSAYLGNAIEVMDMARKAGAQKFAIATSLEKD